MTIEDLKTILVNHLGSESRKPLAVNREIVDQVITDQNTKEVPCSDVYAFQTDGTTVILSDAGLTLPRHVVFLDLKSNASFLQEIQP